MHGWETRMLLRHYLQRGVSKAALARRFGVSRRTIHEWVETGQLDRDLSSGGARYSPRPAVPHKLAPYTGIIEARLEEFPGLSAKRLFDEVRAAGYPGGYTRCFQKVPSGVTVQSAPIQGARTCSPCSRKRRVCGVASEAVLQPERHCPVFQAVEHQLARERGHAVRSHRCVAADD